MRSFWFCLLLIEFFIGKFLPVELKFILLIRWMQSTIWLWLHIFPLLPPGLCLFSRSRLPTWLFPWSPAYQALLKKKRFIAGIKNNLGLFIFLLLVIKKKFVFTCVAITNSCLFVVTIKLQQIIIRWLID